MQQTSKTGDARTVTREDSCDGLPPEWRPSIPERSILSVDSSETIVEPTPPGHRYFRTRFLISFVDSIDGPTACRVLNRYEAQVIGGAADARRTRSYVIKTPDPGSTWAKWDSLKTSLSAEPAFNLVLPIPYGNTFDPRDPG
jgi:hypothetical protein